ncbi:MAG: hypothetical protein EAZ60_08710 [Oscillatoriales cyanobacterium]|nr:MAG: hypothetical protein EAZ83_01825 [Oscillatoriales cyanobacterium]TAE97159.1 MAG: hypothetical protein EAZ79_11895 [Oscillatoriales cyanobacterium]TAF23426.1 MAG: hypothetical protein EAZ73_02165 [Oscillatoriales cyanobacterium]TAF30423.1 MAG: hypothetical protein EAZ69_22385 [Oscillatoriales cyanobacterium]TAF56804.1 MAG: hypothetical protein EAZ60_08710 [Oscillatoriales cyanobacterium]
MLCFLGDRPRQPIAPDNGPLVAFTVPTQSERYPRTAARPKKGYELCLIFTFPLVFRMIAYKNSRLPFLYYLQLIK